MRYFMLLTYFSVLVSSFPITLNWFNEGEEQRLIKLGPDKYEIIKESDKFNLKRSNINFIDITNQIPIEEAYSQGLISKPSLSLLDDVLLFGSKQIHTLKKPISVYNYPTTVRYYKAVKGLFENINTDLMFQNLSKFTSFYTRYYKSKTGLESANWLFRRISNIIEEVKDNVSITKVKHKGWDQYSIIVSIPGEITDKVIVGSHQDSTNLLFPNLLKAPGADDNGSGTITVLEALRVLIDEYKDNRFVPYNTLEFHFYSAEEAGLLGSFDVFSNYANNNETVVGMLQQDMTGYTAKTIDAGVEPHVGLITDYTSVNLNNFLKLIIDEYNSIPYHETVCGYACSDHSSALENGYPSSFVIESEFFLSNNYIHSVLDTIDRLDWDHMKEHVKLTIAYAYELSLARNL